MFFLRALQAECTCVSVSIEKDTKRHFANLGATIHSALAPSQFLHTSAPESFTQRCFRVLHLSRAETPARVSLVSDAAMKSRTACSRAASRPSWQSDETYRMHASAILHVSSQIELLSDRRQSIKSRRGKLTVVAGVSWSVPVPVHPRARRAPARRLPSIPEAARGLGRGKRRESQQSLKEAGGRARALRRPGLALPRSKRSESSLRRAAYTFGGRQRDRVVGEILTATRSCNFRL